MSVYKTKQHFLHFLFFHLLAYLKGKYHIPLDADIGMQTEWRCEHFPVLFLISVSQRHWCAHGCGHKHYPCYELLSLVTCRMVPV